MPVSVIVRSATRAGEAPTLTFDGDRVVVGRGAFADVRLPDPSVSARHATLRAQAGEYVLIDEGSTNGTFVGGVRLTPHAPRTVRSGDLVRVGRVWLEVRTDAAPITSDLPLATRDLAFGLVQEAMRAVGDETAPTVRVVEGPDHGAMLVLGEEGHAYVVGRGESCALLLADADASREHVQVVRRGASVLVRDLGGKNQAALGESWLPADRDIVWRRPAMLRVGRSVLALAEPVAEALAELEAAVDEALPEGGSPPPPSSHGPRSLGVGAAGAAPIAEVPPPVAVAPARRRSDWSTTDIAVGGAALLVIILSAGGLYWLFHG